MLKTVAKNKSHKQYHIRSHGQFRIVFLWKKKGKKKVKEREIFQSCMQQSDNH